MSWDAKDVALLKELWAAGHSAGQIASQARPQPQRRERQAETLGPQAGSQAADGQPEDRGRADAKPALAAACARPVDRVVSKPKLKSKPAATPTRELTKRELYAMLANAVRNTG